MGRVRRSVDLQRLAAAVSRPGIDPRQWLVKCSVIDVAFDPDAGLFADVQYQPDGVIETVLVGTGYAGNDFGQFWPIKVDDIVLVAFPMGDPGEGGFIVSRMWSGSEKPPKELSAGDLGVSGGDVTSDPTLRIENGATLRIVGKGGANYKVELDGGASFEITATGGSKVVISADTTIEITGTASVTVKSSGPIVVDSPQVTVGSAGDAFPIARVGVDFVVPAAPGTPVPIIPGTSIANAPTLLPGDPILHVARG